MKTNNGPDMRYYVIRHTLDGVPFAISYRSYKIAFHAYCFWRKFNEDVKLKLTANHQPCMVLYEL